MKNQSGLHLVIIELTERCNLSCSHCYVGDGSSFSREMSTSDFRIVLAQIVSLGVSFVSLSGGEPLLLGHRLFEYAAMLKCHGIHTTIVSNGLLISQHSVDNYASFDHIQFSMDGPRAVHDSIRGRGCYDGLIEAIEYLRPVVADRLSLRMTLHSVNFGYLAQTYEVAKMLGVRFSVERFTPPQDFSSEQLSPLTPTQLKETLRFCREHKIHSLDPLMNVVRFKEEGLMVAQDRIAGGCTAGIAGLAVTTSLDVLPCVRIRKPVGNLTHQSLDQLWHSSEMLCTLRDRRNFRSCGSCDYRCICGGCRAVSFGTSGSVIGDDTQCWIST